MRPPSLLDGLVQPLKLVWRSFLPQMKAAVDWRDRLLLRTRLALRRRFPTPGNSFPGISALDIPVMVVNLKKRPDRLREVEANLREIGFWDIRVVEAIDGPAAYPDLPRGDAANLGCTLSHQAGVQQALKSGQPMAVCEDDNQFLASASEIHTLIERFLAAPEFDVLCLSARVRSPKVPATEDFTVVSWAMAPAFYIAKPRARKGLLAAYRKSVNLLSSRRRGGPFDQVWKSTQRYCLMFVTPTQRVARQKESHSDIQGKYFEGT